MSTIQSIQLFVIINLFITGLSHFLRPKIWIEFFEYLHKRGNVGNIFNGLLSVGMGSLIVSFHLIWTWPMIIITIYGLALLFKGLLYLTFPSVGLRSIGKVNSKFEKFKWVGLSMSIISLFLFARLIYTL